MSVVIEAIETFECFGGRVNVIVAGDGEMGSPALGARIAKRMLLEWHARFSRFEPASELARLNDDSRATVPVSPVMVELVRATIVAAEQSGGLVDATMIRQIEAAGYTEHLAAPGLALSEALAIAPPRRPAAPSSEQRWRQVAFDLEAGTVTRPPGLSFDSGGIAKGLFGDILARLLESHASFAIDCAGDVRLGGRAELQRPVLVESPFDGSTIHSFALSGGAVATSGIGRRSWLTDGATPAHHLLDPATGRPAFTGIVQVTAIAPSGVEAEWRTKAALLSGPQRALRWLPHGGLVVFDDGSLELADPSR
jgi:thiamine biosynthesis lipoprotein